ncbi:uncharacterized protein TNCV_4202871 [Trichonephila clavipes]|uniref:Uncharacterized protein n=1 Tax=Trichonephila clavipes TaxID=2585209 RepID=A0A8X6S5S8_TRICX|nr:uncharacterized protein TNCV_4202871 [Trichonephila clavipes]
MGTGSSLTQNHSRSQSEIQGDLHMCYSVERSRSTGAVFLDIQKALGRIWFSGLIYKLITDIFLPALNHLINSYLVNRSFKLHEGFLATDHLILNHSQVTWTTAELAPPLLTTTPHQREDVSALDRFNVHRCPTRRVFSGTGLEPVKKQATFRYLYHSATAATIHCWTIAKDG